MSDQEKRCVCCDTLLASTALTLICGDCFYAAQKTKFGTGVRCAIHSGEWEPDRISVPR